MAFYGFSQFYYFPSSPFAWFNQRFENFSPEPQIKMEQRQNVHDQLIESSKEMKKEQQTPKKQSSRKQRKKKKFKEEEYGIKGQKEDRNLFSNSLKIFLKYVRDMRETNPKALSYILSQTGDDYTLKEFYSELEKYIPKNRNYISASSTAQLTLGNECQNSFSKVFRILIKHFYLKEMYPAVLTSKKIIGKAKKVQINGGRSVYFKLLCKEN